MTKNRVCKFLGLVVFSFIAASGYADSYACEPKVNGNGSARAPIGTSFSFDLDLNTSNVTGRYYGQTRYAKLDDQNSASFSFDNNVSAIVWKTLIDGKEAWVGMVYSASSADEIPMPGTSLFCKKK